MRALCLFFSVLALASCNDLAVIDYNNIPATVINLPAPESVFEEGQVIEFAGVVSDDQSKTDLEVDWVSSIDGVFPDLLPPDPEGLTGFSSASLSEGVHVITLRARDFEGEIGESSVTIEVLDVPDAPSIEVRHPDLGEMALEDTPYVFLAEVDDRQDLPEDLVVELSANPGGFVCFMTVDGSGNAQCASTLLLGSYLLTFRVEDSDGNIAEALAEFKVVTRDDFDADGDGYSPNGGDCNDGNATIYPGAPEVCDGMDNDCNSLTAIDVGTTCYDDDGDSYCEAPPCVNTPETLVDCDDTSPSISPVGIEVLNGSDDDCDGIIDEGTVVYDDDGDGYCESPPCINSTKTESDCDDDDYTIYPGADEVCADGVDNNCDGVLNEEDAIGCVDFYYDYDGDTYGVAGSTQCWCEDGSFPYTGLDSTDCYDSNANANPDQTAYFTADRGDGSYDFDCSGSEEKQYEGVSGGCDWDVVYLSCDVNGAGWETSEPACGGSGLYINDCDATYDPVCYALCLLSSDPIDCLLNTCGATCDPDYDSLNQGCH